MRAQRTTIPTRKRTDAARRPETDKGAPVAIVMEGIGDSAALKNIRLLDQGGAKH
jgi:hypothetical protein